MADDAALIRPLCHSHSILSLHRNALICKRKFFLTRLEVRTTNRQNFSLMISKENSRDLNSATFQSLSTTIGRFFAPSTMQRATHRYKERLSAFVAQQVRVRQARLSLPCFGPLSELDGKRTGGHTHASGCGGVEGHTASKGPRW